MFVVEQTKDEMYIACVKELILYKSFRYKGTFTWIPNSNNHYERFFFVFDFKIHKYPYTTLYAFDKKFTLKTVYRKKLHKSYSNALLSSDLSSFILQKEGRVCSWYQPESLVVLQLHKILFVLWDVFFLINVTLK